MKILILLTFSFFAFETFAEPSVSQILESKKVAGRRKLLGKFHYIKLSDKRNPTGKFEHYFSLTASDGRGFAYPVVINDKNILKKINSSKGQQFLIYATLDEKQVWVGEIPKVVQVLNVSHANPISMGSLSPSSSNISASNNHLAEMREKGQPMEQPTIKGVNDKVTNAIIFGAGAALLGTILIGK